MTQCAHQFEKLHFQRSGTPILFCPECGHERGTVARPCSALPARSARGGGKRTFAESHLPPARGLPERILQGNAPVSSGGASLA